MITSDDILSLNFYNYGNPFTGSYQGMRYRIIKQKEAKEQIERYSSFEDIKDIQGLRKYTIVVATNDIYVEEIV